MCKRIYTTPAVDVTQITTDFHLCEGSINTGNPTSGLDDDLENGGNNPGDFSRRRRDIWTDEEEEEY